MNHNDIKKMISMIDNNRIEVAVGAFKIAYNSMIPTEITNGEMLIAIACLLGIHVSEQEKDHKLQSLALALNIAINIDNYVDNTEDGKGVKLI